MAISTFLLPMVLSLSLVQLAYAQSLDQGFYANTCPNVVGIVKRTTASFISQSPSLAASLLRLHFHDCFVRVSLPFHACMTPCICIYRYWTKKFLRIMLVITILKGKIINNCYNESIYVARVVLIRLTSLITMSKFLNYTCWQNVRLGSRSRHPIIPSLHVSDLYNINC